jgi:hypothetical protein
MCINNNKKYYGNNTIDEKETERKRESMDAITYVLSIKYR